MRKLLRVLSLLAVLLYIAVGSALVFTGWFGFVPEAWRTLLGIVIIAYGIMRATRLFIGLKK